MYFVLDKKSSFDITLDVIYNLKINKNSYNLLLTINNTNLSFRIIGILNDNKLLIAPENFYFNSELLIKYNVSGNFSATNFNIILESKLDEIPDTISPPSSILRFDKDYLIKLKYEFIKEEEQLTNKLFDKFNNVLKNSNIDFSYIRQSISVIFKDYFIVVNNDDFEVELKNELSKLSLDKNHLNIKLLDYNNVFYSSPINNTFKVYYGLTEKILLKPTITKAIEIAQAAEIAKDVEYKQYDYTNLIGVDCITNTIVFKKYEDNIEFIKKALSN